MKKLLALGIMFLLFLPIGAIAQSDIQQNLGNALEQIAKFFPDDVIHVKINLNDGTLKIFTVVTAGGKVSEFKEGEPANPTLIITSSQSVLTQIYSSPDQTAATTQALNNGGITITGMGALNQVKMFFFKIYSFFSNLFAKK
ncbi:MAG: hypothetical protein V1944_02285 [Candidatus Aenigmatarchaeota archaeon]